MTNPQEHWQPLPPLQIESWGKPLRAAFSIFAPQALWIASAERPVSVALLKLEKVADDFGSYSEVGIGHNRREGRVRTAIATKVESWVGGNPLRWFDHATGGDRPDHREPKGCWPLLLGLTGEQKDRITPRLPRDPYGVKWALRRRIWTRGLDDCDDAWKLEQLVTAMLRQAVEQAPNRSELPTPYLDAGWLFEEERSERRQYWLEEQYVLPAAKELGIKVWSEDGLRLFLTQAMQRSVAEYKGRAREMFPVVCAAVLKEEEQAEAVRHALQPRRMTALGEPLRPPYTVTSAPAAPARGYSVNRVGYEPDIARQIEDVMQRKAAGRG